MKNLAIYIPKLAWTLSASRSVSFFVLLGKLYYFVFSRKIFTRLKSSPFEFCGVFAGLPICYQLRYPMDIASLVEVYVFKEYEWSLDFDPKVIIDLGAHFGDTALYYRNKYPNAHIIAVEPEPKNFERLLENVQGVRGVDIVQADVGGDDGMVTLYVGESSLGHSVQVRGEGVGLDVPQKSLQTLLSEYGYKDADLVKFDIEGAEFSVFNTEDSTRFARAFIGELHFDLDNSTNVYDFVDLFSGFKCEVNELGGRGRFLFRAKTS